MEVLILGALEGLEAEVVDDEQVHSGELGKVPVVAVGGPGGVELGEHSGDRSEEHIIAGTDGAMPQCLGDVAFAGSAGSDDQHADLLLDEAA